MGIREEHCFHQAVLLSTVCSTLGAPPPCVIPKICTRTPLVFQRFYPPYVFPPVPRPRTTCLFPPKQQAAGLWRDSQGGIGQRRISAGCGMVAYSYRRDNGKMSRLSTVLCLIGAISGVWQLGRWTGRRDAQLFLLERTLNSADGLQVMDEDPTLNPAVGHQDLRPSAKVSVPTHEEETSFPAQAKDKLHSGTPTKTLCWYCIAYLHTVVISYRYVDGHTSTHGVRAHCCCGIAVRVSLFHVLKRT